MRGSWERVPSRRGSESRRAAKGTGAEGEGAPGPYSVVPSEVEVRAADDD